MRHRVVCRPNLAPLAAPLCRAAAARCGQRIGFKRALQCSDHARAGVGIGVGLVGGALVAVAAAERLSRAIRHIVAIAVAARVALGRRAKQSV